MAVSELTDQARPIAGIRWGTAASGMRYQGRDDLAIMAMEDGAQLAAICTQNAFCAAPVHVLRRHQQHGQPRYLLINAGNANAGTGAQGMQDAERSCQLLAELGQVPTESVLPCSTGVIGEPMNMAALRPALPTALQALATDNWGRAAGAIITTDTHTKQAFIQCRVQGQTISLSGIAKGSGMICPDMATMLVFLATDANIDASTLQQALQEASADTLNAITVDGDTSTNDACILVASGKLKQPPLQPHSKEMATFTAALSSLCASLAEKVIRDGEGATKLIRIKVQGAVNRKEARTIGYTVAHSPLVKTAFYASDANWGRILAAVGRAPVLPPLNVDSITVHLNELCIVKQGGRAPDYSEALGQQVMQQPEITITVGLGRGTAQTEILSCDLSHEYVSINADYRS